MIQIKKRLKFGDLVRIKSGFYEGETAILTYLCPESGCLCGYIQNDGTDQLHYFYEQELEVIDRGYYFESEDESNEEEQRPNLVSLP